LTQPLLVCAARAQLLDLRPRTQDDQFGCVDPILAQFATNHFARGLRRSALGLIQWDADDQIDVETVPESYQAARPTAIRMKKLTAVAESHRELARVGLGRWRAGSRATSRRRVAIRVERLIRSD